ncbi:FmdB family zinc ribbon protein [Euzebya tangerina]|uniref:FmdB family zinc ribbon protein n=1 Tax=Euzebya tangerina TaxID=591198 RepID=UPI000E319C23|nr:FmdB family zinc ribbon protein [Euzebya tangerina]
MPTYEYECRENGHRFEVKQSFSDDKLTECIECGEPVRKVFSAAGIVFKGSGYYVTDTRSSPGGSNGSKEGGDSSSGSDGSTSGSSGSDSTRSSDSSSGSSSGNKATSSTAASSSGSSSSKSGSNSSSSSSSD